MTQQPIETATTLVTLPQSDFTRTNRTSSTFVLVQAPWEDVTAKEVHWLADAQSTTMIVNQSRSYQMHTVGTSNALVLLPPKKDDGASSITYSVHNNNKKIKRCNNTLCHGRLVQTGGSGAFFLQATQKTPLDAAIIDSVLKQQPNQDRWTLDELQLALQYSHQEIQAVLNQLPMVLVDPNTKTYQLMDEEVIWNTKLAILDTLTEADICYNHAETARIDASSMEQVLTEIVQRMQQLHEIQSDAMARSIACHVLNWLQRLPADSESSPGGAKQNERDLLLDGDKVRVSICGPNSNPITTLPVFFF